MALVARAARVGLRAQPLRARFTKSPSRSFAGGHGPEFDPKNPGLVSIVMDNWIGLKGMVPRVRDGWYWHDPSGAGAVSAGLASQIITAKVRHPNPRLAAATMVAPGEI